MGIEHLDSLLETFFISRQVYGVTGGGLETAAGGSERQMRPNMLAEPTVQRLGHGFAQEAECGKGCGLQMQTAVATQVATAGWLQPRVSKPRLSPSNLASVKTCITQISRGK